MIIAHNPFVIAGCWKWYSRNQNHPFGCVKLSQAPGTGDLPLLTGFVIHGYLGARTLFTKSVGLALSVGSGLSLGMCLILGHVLPVTKRLVGKEGPLVHIGSCIGNIVSRYFVKYESNEGQNFAILDSL